MSRRVLDHERLQVYQRSLAFIVWAEPLLDRLPKALSVRDQLDRAGTSIPLNIAEGNGKFTDADRCRFFDNARGSALECSACLDVLVAKSKARATDVGPGKVMLVEIVSMLVGLIRSNSEVRLHEKPDGGNFLTVARKPVKYTTKGRAKRD
jgi:four helix bundle protein